jgi:hypothetical protein
MGIGADMKASVDALRNELGSTCTLNGSTSLGKCGYKELSPDGAREIMGSDFVDELDGPWAVIEAPAGSGIKEQDYITVTATGKKWIVRRVMKPLCNDVIMAERCICTGEIVS